MSVVAHIFEMKWRNQLDVINQDVAIVIACRIYNVDCFEMYLNRYELIE